MAGPNNGIVAAMADTQSTPTGLNNHDSKEIADVAPAETAATPDPGEAGPDRADGDATGIHEHEHEHDITVGDDVHEEDEEGSVDDASDLISEADEAITAVQNGLVHQFSFEQTPFGKELPRDLRDGTATFNLDYPAKYLDGGPDGPNARFYLGLPKSAKAEIAFNIYCPGPREIRAFWSRTHHSWVYNSLRKPNTVPFVFMGFGGAMISHAMMLFFTAPILGRFNPYGWFNYELDTLVLDYTYCARNQAEKDECSIALHTALHMIQKHQQENASLPNFKLVKISYCPFSFGPDDLPSCTSALEWAFGCDTIELVPHEHGK